MRTKIYFRVVGGIGNQLFIYFTGKALEHLGHKVIFDLKSGFFWDEHGRKPILHYLDNKINKSSWLDVILFYKVKYFTSPFFGFFLKEKTPNTFTDLSHFKKRLYFIEGYFQSYNYFEKYKYEIIENLNFDIIEDKIYLKFQEKIKSSKEPICIHIRTVQKSEKTTKEEEKELLDINYYNQAIKQMFEMFGKKSNFFVFARDLQWAKKNLPKDYKYNFVENTIQNDLYEFILMSNCKNFILANSTFSWWAAYISGSKNVLYRQQTDQFIGINGRYFPKYWNKISQ